ncbi:MAG: START domain-containing protein [Saprospiraceae bacterium]|nr:START domain-containing protein [Saprospiraceae bacterium]MCB9307347.1 START domain-containing protein [Lewinellaceae bacterium]MCB9354681.1 START domain-containing protein [Lewinellaceae bacterium]
MMLKLPLSRFFFFLFAIALIPADVDAQKKSEWKFKNEKDGVKVYYRKTSDVHEIKLVTSLQSSLSGIIHLLNDVDSYHRWGYKLTEAKLLKKVNDKEFYYYSKLDFPWPLNDRDLVLHTFLEQDSASLRVTSTSKAQPDMVPENKDIVRIKTTTTKWTLVPGANGWVYVEYYINSNPGGSIPDWLVNMAIDVGPRETIKNMRKILKEPKYQAAKLAYIKE